MYNSSEEDLFPGYGWDHTIGDMKYDPKENSVKRVKAAATFDPLKAQVRRAEIYKRALELFVAGHNAWITDMYGPEFSCDQSDIDGIINRAKVEVDNAAQS